MVPDFIKDHCDHLEEEEAESKDCKKNKFNLFYTVHPFFGGDPVI